MIEFKQIIGRGTRVRDDYDKLFFTILDYTGSATRLFADPAFDGDPALISEEWIDDQGATTTYEIVERDPSVVEEEPGEYVVGPAIADDEERSKRKYYFDQGSVEIVHHLVYELDPDGKQLRVVKYTDYAADRVRTLYPSAPELRERWADPEQRAAIIASLEERGISFADLAAATNQPEADPFDLLCHVAFNAPLRTRRERADRLRRERTDFFERYGPEARAILEDLLEKYAEHGTAQFKMPDALHLPLISERGNLRTIIDFFGGAQELRQAVRELQALLYAA
jgi:type I restriction enzyme R subunit